MNQKSKTTKHGYLPTAKKPRMHRHDDKVGITKRMFMDMNPQEFLYVLCSIGFPLRRLSNIIRSHNMHLQWVMSEVFDAWYPVARKVGQSEGVLPLTQLEYLMKRGKQVISYDLILSESKHILRSQTY